MTFKSESTSKKYTVTQKAGTIENYVPTGYNMVWGDEFNDARTTDGKPAMPSLTNGNMKPEQVVGATMKFRTT